MLINAATKGSSAVLEIAFSIAIIAGAGIGVYAVTHPVPASHPAVAIAQ